jgi:DEAD/DEAH box helicase domain-containing protein
MKREVFFDIETKKTFSEIGSNDPAGLGVSIVSVYYRELDDNLTELNGKLQSFWERDFPDMWPIFQKADRIIGFNSIEFDIPALMPYVNFPIAKLPHFDIMLELKKVIGRKISLDALAKETLDREKIDTGLNAVLYWKRNDKESLSKLKKYCEEDVVITKDLYDFILHNRYALYKDKWNTLRKVELDFSYPKEENKASQIGLF